MTAYGIVNGTASELTDVDGTTDVPAYSKVTGITLDTTQLLAVLTTAGVAVTKDVPTQSQRHWMAKVLKIGCNPGA